MSFSMIILNQSIKTIQKYATWIQIALSLKLKLNMFIKALQMMLKKDLIHQIMQSRVPTGKNKKVIGLMKDKFGGKMMTEVVALRPNIKKIKEQKMYNKTNNPV